MYKFQLKNEINYTYDLTNSSNYVVSNSDYLYNFIGQISEKSTTVSEGTILINKSKYVPEYSDETSIACESFLTQCNSNCLESNTSPEDIASCQASCTTTYNNCNSAILEEPADAILKMKAKHIFALVESQTIKQIASNNFSTRGIITKFKDFGASGLQAKEIVTSEILQADTIRLSKINTSRVFSYDASYINSRLSFVGYDTKGNPLEINRKGTPTAYIWGYNQLLPIAEIKNANYTSAVTSIGAANLTSLNNDNLSDASVRSFTNLLRGLSNSLVTTYTHDRVFGLTSSTSPANITTFFGFDGLGRLGDVKDTDGKFLKKYAYSYDSPNIITSAMLREATTTESDADNYLKAIISNQYQLNPMLIII